MMNLKTRLLFLLAGAAVTLSLCVVPANAGTLNLTYSLGGGSFTPDSSGTAFIGTASGTSSLGSVSWMDKITPDFSTGAGDGTFKMTFGSGDTLFGTAHYQGDFTNYPLVPFTQLLTVTGGTGSLLLYRGVLTGLELSDQSKGTFTSSGGGTLSATPEPDSLVLLGTGLASLIAYRKRMLFSWLS